MAKSLASLTVILLLVAGLAVSGIAGGLAAVGNRPLVGLDGHLLAPADAAGTVLLAWVCVLAPTLAFAAVGLLGSVALGRSPMGLLMPALLAFALQLAQLLPLPVAVRLALPSHAFLAWRGLFTSPAQTGPLLIGLAVSLAWAVDRDRAGLPAVPAPRLHRPRRTTGRAAASSWVGLLPLAGLVALTVLAVGAGGAAPVAGSGIEQAKLQDSLATAYAHLYRLQTQQLHRPDVTEAQLQSHRGLRQGRLPSRRRGSGQRLAVRRVLAPARRGRSWHRHLPARRHR